MKRTDHLKEQIIQCNLPVEDKTTLLELVDKKTDRSALIIEWLKIAGLTKKAFDIMGIDPHRWFDK